MLHAKLLDGATAPRHDPGGAKTRAAVDRATVTMRVALVRGRSRNMAGDQDHDRSRRDHMTRGVSFVRSACIVAAFMALASVARAQAPGDFAGDPDKSMANAHESF